MEFIALTIFPELFDCLNRYGIIRRAVERKLISIQTINIRDFASDRHRTTDDRPYGGGCGMVMKPEPLAAAIRAAKNMLPGAQTVLLSPQGTVFNQRTAQKLSACSGLIFVCGRYEGVDERVCLNHIDIEVSIGDYILTGGEPAAMIIIDAVARLLPGALGGDDSAGNDTFSHGLIEHAQYTRPAAFEDDAVPEVLLSGNHRKIENWRLESSLIRTFLKRRDLLEKRRLEEKELDILRNWCADLEAIIIAQSSSGSDSPPGDQ